MNEIKCPHCGHVLTAVEMLDYGVETVWGQSGWVDIECPSCDEVFDIKETVVRTWEVRTHA